MKIYANRNRESFLDQCMGKDLWISAIIKNRSNRVMPEKPVYVRILSKNKYRDDYVTYTINAIDESYLINNLLNPNALNWLRREMNTKQSCTTHDLVIYRGNESYTTEELMEIIENNVVY